MSRSYSYVVFLGAEDISSLLLIGTHSVSLIHILFKPKCDHLLGFVLKGILLGAGDSWARPNSGQRWQIDWNKKYCL